MNKIIIISIIIFYSGLMALGYDNTNTVTVSSMTDIEISMENSITISQWSNGGDGKEQCKNGGWKDLIDPRTGEPFKNQGQCISYFLCLEHGKCDDCECCGDVNIEISNENTSVTNEIRTEANTGGNSGEGGSVETGNAEASTTVTNIVNNTLINIGDLASTTPLLIESEGELDEEILPEEVETEPVPEEEIFSEPSSEIIPDPEPEPVVE